MSTTVSETIPTSIGAVTAPWLTRVLRDAGALGSHDTVSECSHVSLGEGVGLLSEMARFELEYADGVGPIRSLVAKFDTKNEQNHAVGQGFQMYEREARFYQDFAAELGGTCPRAYFSHVVPETGAMVLLMEDLSDYRPGDQVRGATVEEVELAIDAVVRLHAATWSAREREALAWWPPIEGPLYGLGLGGAVAQQFFDVAVANFPESVAPEFLSAADRFKAAVPELHNRMAQGHQVLAHGDFRLDNFMFGTTPEQRPFVMLDMQAPIITKPSHDIAYLLSQSLEVEVRRAHERDLVALYHRKLVEQGVAGYSAEECWEDYRLAVLWCVELALMIAGSLEPGNERGRQFVERCLSRSCQAIVDLDALSLIP